jgi:hydrogenase nickel incorporation protein HypB
MMKTINIRENVLAENDRIASKLRASFARDNIFAINIISSPGSGKTTLLEKTISAIGGQFPIQIIVGDVQTQNDAKRLQKAGANAVQIETHGGCHLDARMIQKKIEQIELQRKSLLIIENVGNLVCPSSYDLGEDVKVVLLSVPEGDEKPLKYPSIFHRAGLMVITKTDMLTMCDFDPRKAHENARVINPNLQFISVSAKTGEGLSDWFKWLRTNFADKTSS